MVYYANGNVHARTDVGTYGYTGCGGTHRVCYVGFSNFSYDANGNMLSGNGRSMTWSSANYPLTIAKGASTEQFLYTPERERVRRISVENGQTTTTVYLNPRIDLGNTFEKTYSPVGAVTYTHHVYAGGQVVGSVNTGPAIAAKTHYFHVDHLGSLTAVTDASGTVVERLSYDAWGKRRKLDSGGDTCNVLSGTYAKRGFTLHEHLDGVDLVHMNGRVYDPLIGHFLSADPNVFYPENQQDFNRYSYVHNNPLSFVDPSGFLVQFTDEYMGNYTMGVAGLDHALAQQAITDIMNNMANANVVTNSYTTGTVTVSGIQSTAASNQYGGASVNTGNTGASGGTATGGGAAVSSNNGGGAAQGVGPTYFDQWQDPDLLLGPNRAPCSPHCADTWGMLTDIAGETAGATVMVMQRVSFSLLDGVSLSLAANEAAVTQSFALYETANTIKSGASILGYAGALIDTGQALGDLGEGNWWGAGKHIAAATSGGIATYVVGVGVATMGVLTSPIVVMGVGIGSVLAPYFGEAIVPYTTPLLCSILDGCN